MPDTPIIPAPSILINAILSILVSPERTAVRILSSDASQLTGNATSVPGVPCYFGTSITAVDATTGEGIASADDYSG